MPAIFSKISKDPHYSHLRPEVQKKRIADLVILSLRNFCSSWLSMLTKSMQCRRQMLRPVSQSTLMSLGQASSQVYKPTELELMLEYNLIN